MNKNNRIKSTLAFATLALTVCTIALSSSFSVKAEYKSQLNRYDDSLNGTTKEALYTYNYENTSEEEAPGYFELSFEKLSGRKPNELIEVKSITETSPIDFATRKPLADAKTVEFKVSDAVYNDGDTLKIRISPQSECKVRPEGGCELGLIPAAIPSKISIKIGLKDSAPKDPSVIFGFGRIYFPEGYDVNRIGWKINVGQADESKLTIPTIDDEPLDVDSLATNAALLQTSPKETTTTGMPYSKNQDKPSNLEIEKKGLLSKNDQAELAVANTQSMSLDESAEKPEISNNLILVVLAITVIAALAGAGLFYLNKQNKVKKAK